MKKIILILLSTTFLASCEYNSEAYNENVCYRSVRSEFPKAHIYHEPGSTNTYWTVIDTNGTYYRVVTGSHNSSKVTRIEKPIEIK